jgi:hypothetical protein
MDTNTHALDDSRRKIYDVLAVATEL